MSSKTKPAAKAAKTAKVTKATKATKAVKGVVSKRPVAKAAPAKRAPVKAAATKAAPAKRVPAKVVTKKAVPAAAKKVAKKDAKSTQAPAQKSVTMRGRSVFVVQTTAKGVVVRSAWLSEDKTLREMPAVFPEVNYALAVVDDLRKQILQHFSQAAQVGARAIASQRKQR